MKYNYDLNGNTMIMLHIVGGLFWQWGQLKHGNIKLETVEFYFWRNNSENNVFFTPEGDLSRLKDRKG